MSGPRHLGWAHLGRAVVASAAFAWAYALLRAADQSLWVDEVATVVMSDLRHLERPLADAQMPLVYVLVACVSGLFGDHEVVLRLVPLVCTAVGLAAYARWLRVHGARPGARALLVASLAIAPATLHYAIEVRAYAPLLAGLLLFAVARGRGGVTSFVATLLLLTSNTFALGYVVAITACDHVLARRRAQAVPVAPIVAACALHTPLVVAVVGLAGSTRLPALIGGASAARPSFTRAWAELLPAYADAVHGPTHRAEVTVVLCTVALFAASASVGARAPDRSDGAAPPGAPAAWPGDPAWTFGLLLGLLLQAGLLAVSGWPIHGRYFLPLTLLTHAGFGLAVAQARPARQTAVAALALVAAHLALPTASSPSPWPSVAAELAPTRDDWRGLTPALHSALRPGDSVSFICHGQCNRYPLDYYAGREGRRFDVPFLEGCVGSLVVLDRDTPDSACPGELVADRGSLRVLRRIPAEAHSDP